MSPTLGYRLLIIWIFRSFPHGIFGVSVPSKLQLEKCSFGFLVIWTLYLGIGLLGV